MIEWTGSSVEERGVSPSGMAPALQAGKMRVQPPPRRKMIKYNLHIKLKIQKSNGYMYFNDKNHPLAIGNSGKVYYHRHVMSLYLGRWLKSGEIIHHIDGNKINNNIDNLIIVDNVEHLRIHNSYLKERKCITCNNTYIPSSNKRKYCSVKCYRIGSRKVVNRPNKEELLVEIKLYSLNFLGKKYGVSNKTISKWLKNT